MTSSEARLTSRARLGDHVVSLVQPVGIPDGEFAIGRPNGLVNDWMRQAACLDEEPEVFFPPGPTALEHINEAKAVCRGCPVVSDCLRVALADPTLVGVWGGTSESQRVEIRRMRRGTRPVSLGAARELSLSDL